VTGNHSRYSSHDLTVFSAYLPVAHDTLHVKAETLMAIDRHHDWDILIFRSKQSIRDAPVTDVVDDNIRRSM